MTTDQSRTSWPLNLPLYLCDYRPGERALTESRLFRDYDLRLLCGVESADVECTDGAPVWDEQTGRQLLDYLVCRGDSVLMAIDITDRDLWLGPRMCVQDLPTAEITGAQMEQGDVADVLEQLKPLLREKGPPMWRCLLQAYPAALRKQLLDAVLLETQENGDTAPTGYGMCRGFVRVLNGDHCMAMCSQRTARRIPDILGERPPFADACRQLSLEERRGAYRSGLLSNGQNAAKLVLEMMDMPLEEYMDGFPDELAQLRESLSDQCTTYGEAAYTIDSMLHSGNADLFDEGVTLMYILSVPPIEDRRMAAAMHVGRKMTGRAPDRIPQRYQRTGQECTGLSFEDRISSLQRKIPAGVKTAFGPQESFFQGVGILAQSGYPMWLSDTLRAFLERPDRCPYVELLCAADNAFHMEERDRDIGIRLLYLLLIEPYRLIYKKYENNRKELTRR